MKFALSKALHDIRVRERERDLVSFSFHQLQFVKKKKKKVLKNLFERKGGIGNDSCSKIKKKKKNLREREKGGNRANPHVSHTARP